MVLIQNNEYDILEDHDRRKIGSGIFLNPYSGSGYYNHKKHNGILNIRSGEGFADIFKSGVDFFKNNSGLIADAASAASGIANVIKTAKQIKKEDEEIYQLKRIKDEVIRKKQEPTFTQAQLDIIDKIRKTGGGIKSV